MTGRQARTQAVLDAAIEVIESAEAAMTVRQVFYQLVSRQVVENTRSRYQAVSDLLVAARKDGDIEWDAIEDRNRRPRTVQMFPKLGDFMAAVRHSYRRDVWQDQDAAVEVWLEKDALSGIFEDVIRPFGVTLNVARGYDGWSSIYLASERLDDSSTVLYFGDFDPSGEDMVRSLEQRLGELDSFPEIVKCALTFEDIARYNLPPAFEKKGDSRAPAFVAKHGAQSSVELDALPVDVLRARLQAEVVARMDLDALARTRREEQAEQERLDEVLTAAGL